MALGPHVSTPGSRILRARAGPASSAISNILFFFSFFFIYKEREAAMVKEHSAIGILATIDR